MGRRRERESRAQRSDRSRPVERVVPALAAVGPVGLRIAAPLIIIAATFVAFAPALTAQFVNFDDDKNITQNYDFRGFSSRNLQWMFSTHKMGHYQPLSWMTLALDFKLWGFAGNDETHASGFHFTNIFLHALTAVAFYFFARLLLSIVLRAPPSGAATWLLPVAALWAALLFAVHPLRCESVCWVTERRDVLSGLFFVLTLTAYLRYATAQVPFNRIVWYALAVGFLSLSLFSKAWGIVMPALLIVLDVWPLRRLRIRTDDSPTSERLALVIVEKIPFVILSGIFMKIASWAQSQQLDTMKTITQHGPVARIAQAFYGLAFYPLRTLWPDRLIPIHEIPKTLQEHPFETPFALAALGVIVVTAALILLRWRFPAGLAAWVCYAAIVSPVLGLLQSGPQLVADRYSYLSCMPFALLAAGGVLMLAYRKPALKLVGNAIVAAAIVGLGVLCYQQSGIWRSSDALWSHTAQVNPNSSVALLNLGIVRKNQATAARDARRPAEAVKLLRESIDLYERGNKIDPNSRNLTNVANAYSILSDLSPPPQKQEYLDLAIQRCDQAIAMSEAQHLPLPEFRINKGVLLLKTGRQQEAYAEFDWAVRAQPTNKNARNNLAIVLRNLRRYDEAIEQLRQAIALDPNYVNAWINLGQSYESARRFEEARQAYGKVLQLRPKDLEAQATLRRLQGK